MFSNLLNASQLKLGVVVEASKHRRRLRLMILHNLSDLFSQEHFR